MIIDLLLVAPNENALRGILPSSMIHEGNISQASHDHAIDWGFPIVDVEAITDVDGNITTPAVMSTKFHANLRIFSEELLAEFEDSGLVRATLRGGNTTFGVKPTKIQRVWF